MQTIYPLFIRLPDMFDNPGHVITKAELLAEKARAAGLDVGVIFDYFMIDPYHGAAPHINPANGQMYGDNKRRNAGRGYYPFSWRPGWGRAEDAIADILAAIEPSYVQQGVNADELNWPTTLPKDHWYRGYNDTMGMFEGAVRATGWAGTWVVSGFYNRSLPKAREKFGSAITDTDFLNRCTLELPEDPVDPPVDPPDDTLAARVALLELVTAKIVDLLSVIKNELNSWEVS